MCGSLFSGFEESAGETVEKNGKKYKEYFGSASNHAMKKTMEKRNPQSSRGRHTLFLIRGLHTGFLNGPVWVDAEHGNLYRR